MGRDVRFHCDCGEVHGRLRDAAPESVNRVVCYCDDCQAYLHHLERADLLDEHGGTDIVQVAPASLGFERGQERIVGLRLTAKGLYRWYASCCKTPLGNHVTTAVPFIGIGAHAFSKSGTDVDSVFGRPVGAILGRFAVGGAPPGSTGLNVRLLGRAAAKVLSWRFGGRTWPHPFVDRATRTPLRPLTTISREEREALRAFCGPHPTAAPRSTSASPRAPAP